MLQYFKTILVKVSFHPEIFEKELKKALSILLPSEVNEFKDWCYSQFGVSHEAILHRNFASAA